MINQLNLFDPEKYSSPSPDGRPDWFYDTEGGEEYAPSVSPIKKKNNSEQSGKESSKRSQGDADSIPGQFSQVNSTEKITGGGNSTPGEEATPGAIVPTCSGKGNLGQTREGDRHIDTSSPGVENLEDIPEGDRHIESDRTDGEQNSKNIGMLGNADLIRPGSLASPSNLLTEEEGRVYWDDLIFGQKTTIPERVALETSRDCADRPLGGSNQKRVQSDDFTLDIVSDDSSRSAISSENIQLGDQRKHNGKPGASGWIGRQYKYRDHLGKSRTSSQWIPGCAGPYYHYQWREGDKVTTIYLPRKKLEAVESAIARRDSIQQILMMLG